MSLPDAVEVSWKTFSGKPWVLPLAQAPDCLDIRSVCRFGMTRLDDAPGRYMIVEDFNNGVAGMATVNFSVPDNIRDDFNRMFKNENKSAIIAGLMQRAVAEVRLQKRREAIFRQITAERPKRPAASDADITAARRQGRP